MLNVIYQLLSRMIPTRTFINQPRRIVLILPCCIGDVVLATALLKALRRAYPDSHITWAVGGWSRRAVENHLLLDSILDTGPQALPVKSLGGFWRFVRLLRAGGFDTAVSLSRSPLMSAAVFLSGIPQRIGLDSAGRGFGYGLRVPVNPFERRHEAEMYLDVARALKIDTEGCYPTIPVLDSAREVVQAKLRGAGIEKVYLVINPAGGSNPGMRLDAKRWPPDHFAALAGRLMTALDCDLVLIGGTGDESLVEALQNRLRKPAAALIDMHFSEIAALAHDARLYIGNDTGLTHLAAAAGAKTVMMMGPSDPARYAPYAPDAIALWKPTRVQMDGVVGGAPADWDWTRDGIGAEEAYQQIMRFLQPENP